MAAHQSLGPEAIYPCLELACLPPLNLEGYHCIINIMYICIYKHILNAMYCSLYSVILRRYSSAPLNHIQKQNHLLPYNILLIQLCLARALTHYRLLSNISCLLLIPYCTN